MEIKTIKNYKSLAKKFEEITKCECSSIQEVDPHHYHFGMTKNGLNIAVICYNDGEITVAPFENNNKKFSNDCYLSLSCFPIFDDFVTLMNGLKDLVVEE